MVLQWYAGGAWWPSPTRVALTVLKVSKPTDKLKLIVNMLTIYLS
jgi:hypothetical protein